MMRRLILGLCAALLLGGPAIAQTYPNKPIRLVVGYSAGGGNDLIARIVAAKLQEKLGQPIVVDNKPGAQSIVAAELVAKAAARRLHAAGGAERADDHQSRRLCQAALRTGQGFCADLAARRVPACCWWSAPTSRSSRCAS